MGDKTVKGIRYEGYYFAMNQPELKVGFVHIPYEPRQTIEKPTMASMSLDTVVEGLKVIIKAVARKL